MEKRIIKFSPPDMGEQEIAGVTEALKSGWITTGPKTKELEKKLSKFCGTKYTACLNSATAALELTLRVLGVGPGDEVITSAYTYTSSASVIDHVGAKIVFVDTQKDSLEMDYDAMANAITDKTKVIIPVDVAGVLCDYDMIYEKLDEKKNLYHPVNDIQKCFDRVIVMADAAHSIGARRDGHKSGTFADFSCFSFHAVKNLTTAEGGAVTWKDRKGFDNDKMYQEYQLLSLHGQNKDALKKNQLGAWEYDIIYPAYKCNMTDIMASIGLAQLNRYEDLLARRREIVKKYNKAFKGMNIQVLPHLYEGGFGSCHVYITRVLDADDARRREIIIKMAEQGIACNVHYKPLPMMTAYRRLGFDIKDYPNSYDFYHNEITLPLHTLLTDDDVDYIIYNFKKMINETK